MDATARYQAEGGDVADASLPYNADASRVEYIIERTRPMIARLRNPALEALFAELGELPPLPEQLSGLNQMIDEQANESTASVAPLFRGCMPYLKQLMELLNNPLFGSSRHLFSINEAVRVVGLRTLRDLGIMAHIINTFPQPEGWSSFSFEQLLSRNLVCAHLSERIAHSVGSDRIALSAALAAGLLHDFGMRVLVRLDQQRYFRVMEKAAALKQPVYAVEKLDYKLTHGELGASMLRRWGVSPRIVRAVLYHHVPKAAGDNTFTTLTAAHVADAMLPPLFNAMECPLGGRLSLSYLDAIGEMDRVSVWERLANDHGKQLQAHW
ncbi:two-component system response regulator [Marinobacterium zhoushanense]|uniref:Two-component system response regulator n=2 Tax=Marinobacterium zhoushanense TaxID=1679163 RepID=A0ABQ1KMC4_9GAMM|nr:two-component system response regulator [Marinobacterium zhoushanense]